MDQGGVRQSSSLWVYWAEIAVDHARKARKARTTDAKIDEISAKIARLPDVKEVPDEPEAVGTAETKHAMIAISAAAHAIDGFYGSVKSLVEPPSSHAKRSRQILETLKLGFEIGADWSNWMTELDWLFATRDEAVHSSEELRPVILRRTTAETAVFSSPELRDLSGLEAQRAADIARTVILTCLERPKESTKPWAELRAEITRKVLFS
jgi:hypothetical protein